jgi:hypothetical protein
MSTGIVMEHLRKTAFSYQLDDTVAIYRMSARDELGGVLRHGKM